MTTPVAWGPEFLLNTETDGKQEGPRIAVLPDGRFLAVWAHDPTDYTEDETIRGQLFDSSGTKIGDEIVMDPGDRSIGEVSVVVADDGDFIVLNGSSIGLTEGFRLDRDGNVLLQEIIGGRQVNLITQQDGGFIAVFNTNTGSKDIYIGPFDNKLESTEDRTLLAEDAGVIIDAFKINE